MDYNHISSFLDKFKKVLFKKEECCKVISMVIQKHTSLSIEPKKIKIIGKNIYIQSSPIQKSEILIHKNSILNDIKQNLKERVFIDIN